MAARGIDAPDAEIAEFVKIDASMLEAHQYGYDPVRN
jgi:hypothetical protein